MNACISTGGARQTEAICGTKGSVKIGTEQELKAVRFVGKQRELRIV